MTDAWNGLPAYPERDSQGHVIRVDGLIDIFSWNAKSRIFEDAKGRWVAPAELVNDGDQYLGMIVNAEFFRGLVEGFIDDYRSALFTSTNETCELRREMGLNPEYICMPRRIAVLADAVDQDHDGG